jgi:3-deoxy-manno-octulosonate cytidylyltransferase (CMP-KDO synthetase)
MSQPLKIAGIIPARYASTRFPGKALTDIDGKTMLQRVYEQAIKSAQLAAVVVATDDDRIYAHVQSFEGQVVMTSPHHPSGTDRCLEALQLLPEQYDYVINIQGDEPFVVPAQIDELAAALDGTAEIATQMISVSNHADLFSTGEVKIVLNDAMDALYFSRMAIPYLKGVPEHEWHLHHTYYRHVGMYAYRCDVLAAIAALPISTLEKSESLEQLRWLQHGFKIRCLPTTYESHCIDTPEDVERVLALFKV